MKKSNLNFKKNILCTCMLFSFVVTPVVWAGATFDGTTDSGTTATLSNDFIVTEADGSLRGTNLFHSFSDFNINAGESATFTGTSPINNVVSRVTGTGNTTINGALISTISGANFYFINPNGIIFKEGASISVDGSFYASTSDFIRLAQNEIFYADDRTGSVMTSSPPSSFGFLDGNIGQITFENVGLETGTSLNLPLGSSFNIISGDAILNTGSFLRFEQTPINIISVASEGEVTFAAGYDVSSFGTLGNVTISDGTIIDAKDVYIRGGNITISNAIIAPGYSYWKGLTTYRPHGGTIDLEARNQVTITGTTDMGLSRPDYGNYLAGISTIGGYLWNSSDASDIKINGNQILISGVASVTSVRMGAGEAANIEVGGANTSLVEVSNGASVSNYNVYRGNGGNIVVTADQVILDGENDTSGLTGLLASSNFNPFFADSRLGANRFYSALADANSGTITVNANGAEGLTIRNGAIISTESRAFGSGGDIVIDASNINFSRDGSNSGAIASHSFFAGDSGNITITSDNNINITGGFVLSATTAGTGAGGDISITAGDTINLSGKNSGIASAAPEPSDTIKNLLANKFRLSSFESLIYWINLYNSYYSQPLLQTNADMYQVMTDLQKFRFIRLGISPITAGDAGFITVNASRLNMNDGSAISTSTSSDGHGGPLNINVDKLAMKNGAEIRSRSGLYNNGVLEVGSGDGGDITINASKSISMKSGSSISASSLGTGLAGNINIDAGRLLNLTDSSITTQATVSDGGNITIKAIDQIYLDNSNITTSVGNGSGNGGNIDIDPEFFIIKSSNILANAYGGNGGNITLVADHFITTPDSIIDASSALGIDGSVNISSPDEDVSDDLAVLPDNYLDVTSLIAPRCGAQSGSSSIVNAGAAGIAVDPDGYLPSFAVAENAENKKKTNHKLASKQKHWSKGYLAQSEITLAQLSCNTN